MQTDDMQDMQQDANAEEQAARAVVTDLASLNMQVGADSGTVVYLEHPATGQLLYDATGQPLFVEVLGESSKKVRAADRRADDRRSELFRKNRGNAVDAEFKEREAVARLAAATVRWNVPPVDGKPLPCTPQNVQYLYGHPGFIWIAEQVDRAMKDRKLFFATGSTP